MAASASGPHYRARGRPPPGRPDRLPRPGASGDNERPAKRRSGALLQGADRAPARAMLKAGGFSYDDLSRPLVGVANTWIEVMPCNVHLRQLAEHVKEGVRASGGTPIEFNTIAVSDGISM